jgi:hypothetical protein
MSGFVRDCRSRLPGAAMLGTSGMKISFPDAEGELNLRDRVLVKVIACRGAQQESILSLRINPLDGISTLFVDL